MYEGVVTPFADWQNFYVIVGSAAAALTGLMFVAVVMVAQVRGPVGRESIDAYNSPTVAHFCGVIFIAVTLNAPWHARWNAGLVLAVGGVLGLVYAAVAAWRIVQIEVYRPEWEDWLWYVALPLIAYACLVGAAIVLPEAETPALFVIAGATLALLFTAIHNAWDIVTFIAIERVRPPGERDE